MIFVVFVCMHVVVVILVRLVVVAIGGCVVLVRYFGFLHCGATFICVWTIQTIKIYSIRDKKIISMVFSMLQNWSQRYYSHNSNIKCIDKGC